MITEVTLNFLSELKFNNNKEWFHANKKRYDAAKSEFLDLVELFGFQLQTIDPNYVYSPENVKIFRINRDIRFSKDKSPYKTNLGAYFARGGQKSVYAGYYLHIEPGNQSFAGGGMYQPESKLLDKLREHISQIYEDLETILEDKVFKKYFPDGFEEFEKLKTVPRGFDKADPAAEVLKNKSFVVTHSFKDKEVTSRDFVSGVISTYEQLYKLNTFLNKIHT